MDCVTSQGSGSSHDRNIGITDMNNNACIQEGENDTELSKVAEDMEVCGSYVGHNDGEDIVANKSSNENNQVPENGDESCHKYELLCDVTNSCVASLCNKKYIHGKFSKAFKKLSKQNPEELRVISEAFADCYQENVKVDIANHLEEANVKSLLCELFKTETSNEEEPWRPSNIPSEDVKHRVGMAAYKGLKQLQELLVEEHRKTAEQEEVVKRAEAEAAQLYAQVETQLAAFNCAKDMCIRNTKELLQAACDPLA